MAVSVDVTYILPAARGADACDHEAWILAENPNSTAVFCDQVMSMDSSGFASTCKRARKVSRAHGDLRAVRHMIFRVKPETRGGSFALVHSAQCVISAFGARPGLQIPAEPARRAQSNGALVCFGIDRIDENPPDENGHIHVARGSGWIFRTCAVSKMCYLGFWSHIGPADTGRSAPPRAI